MGMFSWNSQCSELITRPSLYAFTGLGFEMTRRSWGRAGILEKSNSSGAKIRAPKSNPREPGSTSSENERAAGAVGGTGPAEVAAPAGPDSAEAESKEKAADPARGGTEPAASVGPGNWQATGAELVAGTGLEPVTFWL